MPEKKARTTQSREHKHCRIEGCKRPYRAKGYCNVHYKEWRHGERPKPRYKRCGHEGCNKPAVARGLCEEHRKPVKAQGAAA